jgi:hypothetical protein
MKGWVHLIASMIAMIMIANLQCSWALFVKPKELVIFCAAQFLKNPEPNDREIAGKKATSRFKLRSHAEQFTSFEMLRTPQFYVLDAMMLMIGIGGLMVTAQVGSVADTLGISKIAFTRRSRSTRWRTAAAFFGDGSQTIWLSGLSRCPWRPSIAGRTGGQECVSLDGWLVRI